MSRALDRTLIRRVMVAAQVAGSCLLLIVARMMVRSVQRVLLTDLGFDYERAAVLAIPLGRYGVTGNEAQSLHSLCVARRRCSSASHQRR